MTAPTNAPEPTIPLDESGASAGCAVGGASDDRAAIEAAAARAGVVRDGHGWSHVPKGDWLAVWFDYGDWRTGSAGRVIPHPTELDALLALPPAPGIAEAEQRAGLSLDVDTATWRRTNGGPVVWYLPGEGPWLVDTGERLVRCPTLLEALHEAPSADAVAFVERFAARCQDAPEPAPERVVSPAPSPLAAGGESSASGVGLSPAPTLVEPSPASGAGLHVVTRAVPTPRAADVLDNAATRLVLARLLNHHRPEVAMAAAQAIADEVSRG